ncbi:uncharacterized protein VTP21DRAFT_3513 [Calcarisporiella thermophila]|uniref:uncharacterized protein n=1 Tax=Calcarisporiella thermophila TaxID=911321 RepID=UPI003743F30D
MAATSFLLARKLSFSSISCSSADNNDDTTYTQLTPHLIESSIQAMDARYVPPLWYGYVRRRTSPAPQTVSAALSRPSPPLSPMLHVCSTGSP